MSDEPAVEVTLEAGGPPGGGSSGESPAEAIADAQGLSESAAVVVATAGAAAALAQQTAAHAELQAAEEIRDVAQEADAWRTATAGQIQEIGQTLVSLNDKLSAIDSREAATATTQIALLERLEALEIAELSRSSTPPASADEADGTEATSAEERTATATLVEPGVGTEAAANLGPVEVGGAASLDSTRPEPPNPNAGARPRVLRRWI